MRKTETIDRRAVKKTKKIWLRLTRMCNNNCLFCLDKDVLNGTSIHLGHMRKRIDEASRLGAERIVLSGGEPTLHPQFHKILKLAKNAHFKQIQVITNGRMFAYADFLKTCMACGLSEITFSLHGHNQRLHDRLTQSPGSFIETLKGLKNALALRKNGLIINIDIVINKINIGFLDKILKFFIKLGVDEFDLLNIIPFGRAWEYKDRLFYDKKKHLSSLRKAFVLSKNPSLHFWTNRFPAEYLEGYEFLIQDSVKLYDEINGRLKIFMDFFHNNEEIPCFGSRCKYCFLKLFCRDLIELKEKHILAGYTVPFCLKEKGLPPTLKNCYKIKKNKIDVFDFLDFFVKERYFIKSLRCKKCSFYYSCEGMQYDYLRENGLRVLKPLLKQMTRRQGNYDRNRHLPPMQF